MVADSVGGVGRPREARVGDALLTAALHQVSEHGVAGATIAGIAARAGTSKQAIYRRHKDKAALIAAAVGAALLDVERPPPLRSSVAGDLRRFLAGLAGTLQDEPLRGALRALLPYRFAAAFSPVFDEVETGQRLALRQILIATPFEAGMEARIDLLLGYLHHRLLVRTGRVSDADIELVVQLVLGLVAPRDPRPDSGFPGL